MKAKPQSLNQILVGTSGFAYKEWKGSFYPEDLPAKKYLSYYAEHFHTTEINNTFYRMPTAKLCEGWYAEVPDNFSFTLKLSQRITHFKRLKNVDDEMSFFLESAAALKEKLGPILVQLPPNYKKDIDVLDAFLGAFATKGSSPLSSGTSRGSQTRSTICFENTRQPWVWWKRKRTKVLRRLVR